MKDIQQQITPVNQDILAQAKAYTATLAMPSRAMGELNTLSERLCAIQSTLKPSVDKRELFIVAADHGIYDEGVAPYPQVVTMQMMQLMISGRSSACIYAKHANAGVTLIDIASKGDVVLPSTLTSTFYDRKVARGSANFAKGPAMSREEAVESIKRCYQIASQHIKERGLNVITIGEMGIANTTPSAAITAVLTGLEPEAVTGYGSGVDKDGWQRKVNAIKAGLAMNKPNKDDAIGVLAAVGGHEIGGMAGLVLAAAAHKVPVVLDGYISTAAAALAAMIAPAAVDYMIAGHESEEQGHKHLLAMLGLKPLLRLGMRLGEGTGAVCALPLLELAAATIGEIATFADLGM
ncbi:MAG: nicotinate-nucleotide--dimethylbenzimidazole phosphoribosyltransferase [Deferribacteraceae bacterium]|jgi:nicotinate-nucleotide--dimethylbenzimidazole phosphoribosyltransferase|nr:nicotinate-nucleotide--dimethylbenzimidazole phosphoribosyltransferase [Deferribacteraceae bacterium]